MSDTEESIGSILKTREAPATAKGEEAAPPAAKSEGVKVDASVKAEGNTIEQKPAQARDESGKFAKAEEKPAEKPDKAEPAKPRADVAAIIDERRKRQAAEQRLRELEASQQKPHEKPSVFDNEDKAISMRVDEGTRELREKFYQQSVKIARLTYKEAYAEAEQAFMEAAEKDERLITGLRASDDPGEFIYSMGIHVRELADVGGDLMKYREKVTSQSQVKLDEQAKQIAALTAEIEALKKTQNELSTVPRSLNSQSSGPAPKSGEGDDDDIRSIARFNNRQR